MESVSKNYQLLKASEGCASCNEESTIVQLPETNSFSMDRGFAREFLTPIIIVDLKCLATWSDSVWRCLHPWRRERSRCDGTRSLWWGKLRARSAATAASSRPLSAWSSQNTTCNRRHFSEFWMQWKYHKESSIRVTQFMLWKSRLRQADLREATNVSNTRLNPQLLELS